MENDLASRRVSAGLLTIPAAIAFVLFLTYLSNIRFQPFFKFLVANPLVYDQQAKDLIRGIPSTQPFFLSPLYPGFVAAVYFFTEASRLAVLILQGILLAIDVYLIGLIGNKVFNSWIGFVAALMTTLYWSFYYFAGELLPTVLCITALLAATAGILSDKESLNPLVPVVAAVASSAFVSHIIPTLRLFSGHLAGFHSSRYLPNCLLLVIFAGGALSIVVATLVINRLRGLIQTALSGLLVGIAAIVWSGSLLYAGAVSVWLARRSRKAFAVWLVGVAIPFCASFAHNYAITRELIPLTTSPGVNLFIGNNANSDGMDPFRFGEGDEVRIEADRLGLSGSQRSAFFRRKAIEFIRRNPGSWVKLLARKLLLSLSRFEIDNNADISERRTAWHLSKITFLNFGIVFPLSLVGFVSSRGKNPQVSLLLAGYLSFLAVCVIFFSCERFRLPGIAFLMPVAAYGLVKILRTIFERKFESLVLLLLLAAAGAFLTNFDFLKVADTEFPSIIVNKAYVARLDGDLTRAWDLALKAIRREPSNAGAYFQLGAIEIARGDTAEALGFFLDSLERDPFFYASYQRAREILRQVNISTSYLDTFVNSIIDRKDFKQLRREIEKYVRDRLQQ